MQKTGLASGVQMSGDAGASASLHAPYVILGLSSGVLWSLLMDMRCICRHHMTSYSRLQTNVLVKCVDTTCIFRDAREAVGQGEQ